MHRTHRNEQFLDAVLLGGLLIGGSFLARRAADEVWRLVSDDPPPDLDDPDQDLREVIVWSVISGILVGLTRLLLRRKFAHHRPPSRFGRVRRYLR
jgi:hypothetical protein